MRKALLSLAAIILSVGLIGPTFEQRQAPKSTDLPPKVAAEPETQQQKSKTKASQSGRKGKKPDASIDEGKGKNTERPPTGIEGPEKKKCPSFREFYVTDSPERFLNVGEKFLGQLD